MVRLNMETENQVYKTPWESIIKDVKKDVEKSTASVSSKSSNQSSRMFFSKNFSVGDVWPTDSGATLKPNIFC